MSIPLEEITLPWVNVQVFQAIVSENFNHPDHIATHLPEKELLLSMLGTTHDHALFMYQTHSTDHYLLEQPDELAPDPSYTVKADAISTIVPNVSLFTTTADCIPIVVFAPDIPLVTCIHAGYQGLLNGIVEATVSDIKERFGKNATHMEAYIGPHIKACCYNNNLRPALVKEFQERFGTQTVKRETYIDITFAATSILGALGINEIIVNGACTCCNPDLPSHYRDGETRIKTLIHGARIR